MTRNQHGIWHPEVISQDIVRTLRDLQHRSLVEGFYLAGGTGLALQLGHRRSVDLDFFSETLFNEELLIQKLADTESLSVLSKANSTLHAGVGKVKVSFLGYPYPVLFPFLFFLGIPLVDRRDIACMKISAISSRGTRRDFIDLYVVSKEHGLASLLDLFKKKYSRANYSGIHVLKSLTFFEEAERDPAPDLLVDISWDDVKDFFITQVPALL
jgi:hypothetical protein